MTPGQAVLLVLGYVLPQGLLEPPKRQEPAAGKNLALEHLGPGPFRRREKNPMMRYPWGCCRPMLTNLLRATVPPVRPCRKNFPPLPWVLRLWRSKP